MLHAKTRSSGWQGASLVAITYVYFLIFAQFAFLKRLADLGVADAHLKAVMAAMAVGGVLVSLLAPRLNPWPSANLRLRTGLITCGLAAFLALLPFGFSAAAVLAFLIGAGLGLLTVTLVTHLRQFAGDRNPLFAVGAGTGAGYLICNVPGFFAASAEVQALSAGVLCLAGIAFTFPPPAVQAEARATSPQSAVSFYRALAGFTALVWLDSAAFFIIQNTPSLKAGTWQGSLHLWANGLLHLIAALASAWLLRRRGLSPVLTGAFVALGAACLLLLDTLFGPLVGATVWLYLSDFFQNTLHLGATWKLVLGLVFVLLVCFLRRGLVGGIKDLYEFLIRYLAAHSELKTSPLSAATVKERGAATHAPAIAPAAGITARRRQPSDGSGPVLQAIRLSKRYGGLVANSDINFEVSRGERRGVIGPNGAGKTTFFKMLTCEVPPTSGTIVFEGRDITGMDVTDVCQLGLTKSYQVNQLFTRLTVRENLTIAALAGLRGKFRLDMLRRLENIEGLAEQVEYTLSLVDLTSRAYSAVAELAYGEKRRLEVGLALATSPSLILLDEPLAGMSPLERMEMVKLLKSVGQGRTMIIIDHDMDSLFELVARVTVLQEGRVLVEGTPQEIKCNAAVQEAYLGGVLAA